MAELEKSVIQSILTCVFAVLFRSLRSKFGFDCQCDLPSTFLKQWTFRWKHCLYFNHFTL